MSYEKELEKPTASCRFCNDFTSTLPIEFVPLNEWIEGVTRSTCELCRILVESIRKLDPEILENGTLHDDLVGVYSSASERKLISISISGKGSISNRLMIEFYIGKEKNQSELPFIGSGRDIAATAGNDYMWQFLQECFQQCIQNHPTCSLLQDPTWFPERLLYLTNSVKEECLLKLVESINERSISHYIALSHCWGGSTLVSTTKSKLDSYRKGIPYVDLPRTFQDCVAVAQMLGICYIWIDSLCIIQDERSDWARHAQIMDEIYKNAVLTVMAVSSPDSSTSFLGPEAPTKRDQFQAHNIDVSALTTITPMVKARAYTPLLLPGFIVGPLEQRALAWQERHLSVRTISFTEEEARWQCATVSTCECTGVKYSTELKSSKRPNQKIECPWWEIIEDYSTRFLTFWTDRLPALSGMASRFNRDRESEYLAGLWRSDFPRCLAWYRRELSDCPTGKPCMQRSLDIGIPSWSWASVSGQVHWLWTMDYDDRHTKGHKHNDIDRRKDSPPILTCVELVGYESRPLDYENPYGEVKPESFLELRGKTTIHACGLLRKWQHKPQYVVPDCHIIGEDNFEPKELDNACMDINKYPNRVQLRSRGLRRAFPTDRIISGEGEKVKGTVTCLLLFTAEKNNITRPCILVLSELCTTGSLESNLQPIYQRVGISAAKLTFNGPLYHIRKNWECWENWEDLGDWEEWEEWFANAEEKILQII
ncbi:heterokaryon incompatibility protein [Rutstroemia sp. NJR-2017a WRK4]|nr:heterokaryon incompatibility protein [Rutstroemia sp. NJR-2017a WRK4]